MTCATMYAVCALLLACNCALVHTQISLEKKLVTATDSDDDLTDVDLIIAENEEVEDDLLEGDIVDDSKLRTAVRSENRKWPKNADGIVVIPYNITTRQEYLERHINQIEAVMKEFAARTCLKFVPRTDEKAYLRIRKSKVCSTTVGRKGGPQNVNLNGACTRRKGPIQHELMHTIGFLHEQSRADRDKHIKILWENIKKGRRANFKATGVKGYSLLGLPYDHRSVMHYGPKAFSTNRLPTMVSRDPTKRIGGSKGWTDLDVLKVNTLYKCDFTVTGQPVTKWPSVIAEDNPDETTAGATEMTPGTTETNTEKTPGTTEKPRGTTEKTSGTTKTPGTTEKTPANNGAQTTTTEHNLLTNEDRTSVTMPTVSMGMPTDKVTTVARAPSSTSGRVLCTFDEDLCGFTQGSKDDFDWNWSLEGKGTPTKQTGPGSDHTTGHGRFLYIEATRKLPRKKARGFSPVYTTTGPHCLTFFYHMRGRGIGSLNVYLRTVAKETVALGTSSTSRLWSLSGPQGNKWSKAEVTFNTTSDFQVIIEGVRGVNSRGDIAIDDMTLDPQPCTQQPTSSLPERSGGVRRDLWGNVHMANGRRKARGRRKWRRRME